MKFNEIVTSNEKEALQINGEKLIEWAKQEEPALYAKLLTSLAEYREAITDGKDLIALRLRIEGIRYEERSYK